MTYSFRSARLPAKLCAIVGALAITGLSGCVPPPTPKPVAAPRVQSVHPRTVARNPLNRNQPGFLRLSNLPQGQTPVRVGVLLPFSNGSPATMDLAKAMMNAAQLALFDSRNPNILLMAGDGGSSPQQAASAARTLLAEGAEIIVGPLFAGSVRAVAPIARDRGVPVVSFSTDRSVGGDGVYLLSYQAESEVRRIVSYAGAQGHKSIAALIPRTAYGDRVLTAFQRQAAADRLTVAAIQRFDPNAPDFSGVAQSVAASVAGAILIAQGGEPLNRIALALGPTHPQLLGTGLWADRSLGDDPALTGGLFAVPPPRADDTFDERYRALYGGNPPQLAPLAYDAISLVAALAPGTPYRRFTEQALTDPSGFVGMSGVFRFNPDGSCDRGLAILRMEPGGFQVVDPAPRSFQAPAS